MIIGMDKLRLQPEREWPKALENRPELRASLAKNGLLVPLLVTEDYQIIDGVWRFVEAQALGWTEIEIYIPETYDEACEKISEARLTEPDLVAPITIRRTWQFMQALEPLWHERIQERKDAMWGRKFGSSYKDRIRQKGASREVLATALGLPSEAYIQIIKRVHKAASTEGEQQKLAADLWKDILAETRTLYSAYGVLRRDLEKQNLVSNAHAQRTVLKGTMPVIDALVVSLGALGDMAESITVEEADDWLAKLRKLKRVMIQTQNKLIQHKMDKENEA